jgi:LynF/TruF/PatF family peptide O-prenyltransferase
MGESLMRTRNLSGRSYQLWLTLRNLGNPYMNPLLRMYTVYKKDFGLEENRFLGLFERHFLEFPCSILEWAPQISPGNIHAARFRVGYGQDDKSLGLNLICRYLDQLSKNENVRLNRSILDQIIDKDLDLSRVGKLGIGVDFPESMKNPKVKVYFTIKGYPEKWAQVLATHPPVHAIDAYPMNDTFGINIYFNGRTDIEIYPYLTAADCLNMTLMEKLRLQDISRDLLSACSGLFVSFENDGRRVFHFSLHSPTKFIQMIGNRQLTLLYGNAQIISHIIGRSSDIGPMRVSASFSEDEMFSHEVRHIKLALCYQLWKAA